MPFCPLCDGIAKKSKMKLNNYICKECNEVIDADDIIEKIVHRGRYKI